MSEVTVKQLASTVGIPVERLLAQLNEAGIRASGGDATLTEQEKIQLLSYLRRSYGKSEPPVTPPVTLKRKSVSELRQPAAAPRVAGGTGECGSPPVPAARAKTISVAPLPAKDDEATVRPRRDPAKPEVYVSYAWARERTDPLVDELCKALAAQGLHVHRDCNELRLGGRISHFIERLSKGRCVVVVLSAEYLRSEYRGEKGKRGQYPFQGEKAGEKGSVPFPTLITPTLIAGRMPKKKCM